MKIIKVLVILVFIIITSACLKQNELNIEYTKIPSKITKVTFADTITAGILEIRIEHLGYTDCDTYSNKKVYEAQKEYIINTFNKRPISYSCATVIRKIESNISIKIDKQGWNRLIFNNQFPEGLIRDSVYVK